MCSCFLVFKTLSRIDFFAPTLSHLRASIAISSVPADPQSLEELVNLKLDVALSHSRVTATEEIDAKL